MSIIIAKKGTNNIRFITLETDHINQFDWVLNIIRNFYKKEEKVDALIELGNLEWLGPSPYKKNKGDDDIVNCESRIRDKKLSPGKHGSCVVNTEKDLLSKLSRQHSSHIVNCCFLHENELWYVLVGGHKESIATVDRSILKKETLMDGLTIYSYHPEETYRKLKEESFLKWYEIQQAADEKEKTYYVYRNDRLITQITSNIQQPQKTA